ncbi:sugar phosphate isomerase/epimerase family protein [Vibrio viridaestus]|uniref:Sugar phosphate isomerase/epimerase n=1 Tax=Vibrio viridaestus TaxID=2487322 RepID=A0A3N9U951_9VIBR|nr:sugar phosphate isomerase/epimerase [Vibrio viridaestus]RQW64746.1 sugar phosphate isomerase/epimerase [Vibrio viridaestus]
MKLGLVTDSLANLSTDDVIKTSSQLGLDCLEFATGNWSTAPHIDLQKLLASSQARRDFQTKMDDHGLTISSFNANGNQLHPGESGAIHAKCVDDTIKLAELMNVERVVMMSGLPGGRGDQYPNWIVTSWPPETQDILAYQWEVAEKYWSEISYVARESGVKLCVELLGQQLAYNLPTFRHIREIGGETVGLNFDPSHILWMGGDPMAFIREAADMIYSVHAKDAYIDKFNRGTSTALDHRPMHMIKERSWSYVTLGYGQPEAWWGEFVYLLATYVSPDLTLNIEHEDMNLSRMEGVIKSVDLLKRVAMFEPSDYELPQI